MASPIIVDPSWIPSGDTVIFPDSSFFRYHASLLAPEVVRAAAKAGGHHVGKLRKAPYPVAFPSLGLLVKYGPDITSAEGQTLYMVQRYLHGAVPVPEVFGWLKDGDETFIYMELIQGVTLEERWESLLPHEKADICGQLKPMVQALRQLRQYPDRPFIGNVVGQPLLDIIFADSLSTPAGPFLSVSDFHDWFSRLHRPSYINPEESHPDRAWLRDNVDIAFTHSDFHRSNVILSPTGTPKVLAIVDWHQSGWYPSYWEYCKARWTTTIGEEWESIYLPQFLDPYDGYNGWDFFVLRLGV